MNNLSPSILSTRREALRQALLSTVDLLRRRRACDIDASFIADYVALDWMEWRGGALKLTATGENVCKQLVLVLRYGGPLTSALP